MSRLAGRVALITGASSGIGAATARALARKECPVALAARRLGRLETLAREIHANGGRAHPIAADVTADEDVERMVHETLTTFGRLDIVVCNAGIGYHGSLEDTSPDVMAHLMDVNFMGTFLVARAALPHLRAQPSGHLVIVSSIVGKRGIGWGGAYSATKFAQAGLAEALRAELAGSSVRVTLVLPVSTETEFRDAMARTQGYTVEGRGPRQSATHVGAAIVGAIERPRAEVYPYPPSRALVVLNALAPGVTDRLIRRFGRRPVVHGTT
jgi:short-subunit dehydrogenase